MSSENGVNPPASNPSHNSSFSLLSVLGRERLIGPNYMDWMRNLRFTLRYENKEYALDEQIPTIDDDSTQKEIEAHQKHYAYANKVSCIMASSMSPELQNIFKNTWAYEMNQQLKEMFQAKARKECLDVVKSLMACKPKPGASMCFRLRDERKETSIMELHSLLQTAEQGIKKSDVPSTAFTNSIALNFDIMEQDIRRLFYGRFSFYDPNVDKIKEVKQVVKKKISNDGKMILNVGSSNELDKSKLWHSRLGHVNKKRIAQLQKDGVLESFNFKSDDVCESCLLGKMTKLSFTGTCERGEGLLDLVHTDVSKRGREPTGQKDKVSQLTPPKTPQLNGVAERRKKNLVRHGSIYDESRNTSNKLLGREAQDKLEAKSEKCLFIGYPEESFGYLFYKPKDNVVFVARRGMFFEREMISKEESRSKIDREKIQEFADEEPILNTDTQQEMVTPVEPDDISLPIRRTSGRVSKPPQLYYGFHIEEDKINDSTLSELYEPANYKEAMASLEAAKWKEAMKSKIRSIYDNQV
ncbi:retrotransposon protein, putative, ty1-copia subclass [Tanacetum coccineum]